jgi:hypothetical protein
MKEFVLKYKINLLGFLLLALTACSKKNKSAGEACSEHTECGDKLFCNGKCFRHKQETPKEPQNKYVMTCTATPENMSLDFESNQLAALKKYNIAATVIKGTVSKIEQGMDIYPARKYPVIKLQGKNIYDNIILNLHVQETEKVLSINKGDEIISLCESVGINIIDSVVLHNCVIFDERFSHVNIVCSAEKCGRECAF